MVNSVPRLGLTKIGITPNVNNQRSHKSASSYVPSRPKSVRPVATPTAVAPKPVKASVSSPKASASSRGSAASSKASYKSARSSLTKSASAHTSTKQQQSFRPAPERANPSATQSPRRNKPTPVRGARPGVIGVTKNTNQPEPFWKVIAAKASTLPSHRPDPEQSRKFIKGEKKGVSTGSLPGGARSIYETDMHHHIRRVAAAKTTIDNRVPTAMTKGPLSRSSSLARDASLGRSRNQNSRPPSAASSRTSVSSSRSSAVSISSQPSRKIPKTTQRTSRGSDLAVIEEKNRVQAWAQETSINTDPNKAIFVVAGAGVEGANGQYLFDREGRHGPAFRKSADRRWKMAKGAVDLQYLQDGTTMYKFNNNAKEVDGWYLYNISDWKAIYKLASRVDRAFSNDQRPARLQLWPPSRQGWEALDATGGTAPAVIDDSSGVENLDEFATDTDWGESTLPSPTGWKMESFSSPTGTSQNEVAGRQETSFALRSISALKIRSPSTPTPGQDVEEHDRTLTASDFNTTLNRSATIEEIPNGSSLHPLAVTSRTDVSDPGTEFGDSMNSSSNFKTIPMSQVKGTYSNELHMDELDSSVTPMAPNVMVTTATIDRTPQNSRTMSKDSSFKFSPMPADANSTFALSEIMTPFPNRAKAPLLTRSRFDQVVDESGAKTLIRHQSTDEVPDEKTNRISFSSQPERMDTDTADTVAFLVGANSRESVIRAMSPASKSTRTQIDVDYIDLKSHFSEQAMERDIHTDGALKELADHIIARELNPNLAHFRSDNTGRNPPDEVKMRQALDEVISAMSFMY